MFLCFEYFFYNHTLLRKILLQWTPKLKYLSFARLPVKVMADISNLREVRALPLYQVFSERINKYKFPMERNLVETHKP